MPNLFAKKERLRVQREKKQKYRQRVKKTIATVTTAQKKQKNDESAFLHFRKPT